MATCTCIAEMNARLADHNGGLVCTLFGSPQRVAVEVYQLETGRGKKRPPKAIASYCPFCGTSYDQNPALPPQGGPADGK